MNSCICIAQTVKELKFLLSKSNKDLLIVPLDLEVQIFCLKNNLKFLNPIDYLDKQFHQKALVESENLIKKIKFKNLDYKSNKLIAETFIRFRFNSIFFIKYLIGQICKKNNINEIILSGWDSYDKEYSLDNYHITEIIKCFFNNKKIIILSKNNRSKKKITSIYKEAFINNLNLNNKKKNILISNLGYNLFRFIKAFKRNYNIIIPENEHIGFIKKIILTLFFNVHFLRYSYKHKKNLNIKKPKIKIDYKNKKINKFLTKRFNQEIINLVNLKFKFFAIDKMFEKINFFLVISHNVRGDNGYYLEKANKLNINSVCVPHGTVSKNFNKYDKIYKKVIADSVIFDKTKFVASQSKITNNFLKTKNILSKKTINTGNLIFAEIRKKEDFKRNILFAVTLKKFFNIQFLGVEAFYEFLDNLKFLNNFSSQNKIKILVNLHPAAKDSLIDLKEIFPNLIFKNEKIDKMLKKVNVTLSFSSTVIEDSLNSKIPVILFDRWKRYQHCEAQKNFFKKNSSIYYVDKEENLIKCLNTICNSRHISYKKHTFIGNSNKNIEKFIHSLK